MKSRHTSMKLAPVRVFTCKHPLRCYYGDGNQNNHKTIGFDDKNKGPTRAFSILVHFFAVLGQTTV